MSCTAAMEGIFSRSFCVTATRTVITLAAGPDSFTLHTTPSILSSASSPPPVPAQREARVSTRTRRNDAPLHTQTHP